MKQFNNEAMRRIVIFNFALLIWLVLIKPSFAFAQDQPRQSALGVSPAILELVLTPGEEKEAEVMVINVTKFPLPVKGMVKDFIVSEEIIAEAKGIFDSSSWIRLEPSDFILQPMEEKKIKVTIAPPQTAEPGGHYATIYFQPMVPAEVLSPQTAFIAARVGILNFLVVRGEIVEKASVSELIIKEFQQFGPIEFRFSIKNKGNTHIVPSGSIIITDFRGREMGKISLAPAAVLPKTLREFVLTWEKKYPIGKYLARGEFLYGTEHQKMKTNPIVFWVVPLVPILCLIALLTTTILFLTIVRRRIILALRVLLGKAEVRGEDLLEYKKARVFKHREKLKVQLLRKTKLQENNQKLLGILLLAALGVAAIFVRAKPVSAAELTGSAALTDSRPSTSGIGYSGTFSNVSVSAIKCIIFNLSSTAAGTTAPMAGVGTTSATLGADSDYVPNIGSWTLDKALNGTLKMTFAGGTAPVSAGSRKINFDGISNGSTPDVQYYLRINTYNNEDCSSSAVDNSVFNFIWTTGQTVSLTVDPSIAFTLASVAVGQTVNSSAVTVATTTSTIPFGTLTSTANAVAAHDATVTTNAGSGYTVFIKYSGVPTSSGSDTIADLAIYTNASPGTFSAAGTAAFGYTTEEGTLGTEPPARFTGGKWAAFTTGNLEVMYNSAAISNHTHRFGYQVGVSGTTPAGTYNTTVVLTATPSY